MRIHPIHFSFLRPYCEEAELFVDPAEAACVLTMNQFGIQDYTPLAPMERMAECRLLADKCGLPLCYWTIEDPNSYQHTLPQARMADYIFTSDREMVNQYRYDLGNHRVYWLPLAASEDYHRPLPLADDAADFVVSCNFYPNEARVWANATVLLPLARAGYSMQIFAYAVNPDMPDELRPFVQGDGAVDGQPPCRCVANQYRHGRIVLGMNNQRSGMDGRGCTVMTSMRTFEALACGKPFLAAQSDAYEALGLTFFDFSPAYVLDGARVPQRYGGNLAVTSSAEETLRLAEALLADDHGIAERGRAYVLSSHTYRHRLERIGRAVQGEADPEGWR